MKKVAILLENLFDEQEVIYPYHRLREDYEVHLISPKKGSYKSKEGFSLEADFSVDEVSPDDYAGVYIPGGFSPDYMRRSQELKDFVSKIYKAGKPLAAICHGPWMLISSIDLRDKEVTGFYAIKDDLVNAGAKYLDQKLVVDGNIITSRTPKDLPANVKEFVKQIG